MVFITLTFTFFLNPTLFVKQHSYKLGDVAKRDVKAPKDFYIEDTVATEANRKQAMDSVLTVYDYDTALLSDITARVYHGFKELRTILTPEELPAVPAPEAPIDDDIDQPEIPPDQDLKAIFEDMIGLPISSGAFQILKKEQFSTNISSIINDILTTILENGVVTNKEMLLKESDEGIVLKELGTNEEKIVKNLKRIYGLDQAKTMVRIVGEPILKDTNYNLKNLIVDLSQKLIQPNITLNKNETETRLKMAEAEVKSVLYMIKEGEMLLREGERVTLPQLIKLKNLETQTKQKHIVTSSVGTAMLILAFLLISYVLHLQRQKKMDRNLNKHIFFMALVLLTFLFMVKMFAFFPASKSFDMPLSVSEDAPVPYALPMAAASMTICLFLGMDIAIPFALILSLFSTIIFQNRFELFIYFFLQSAMATFWLQDCRERKVFIKAGLKISLLNIFLVTAIDIYMDQLSAERLMLGWIFGFGSGIMSGIITSGIAPIVEILFDYSTDIKLLELANLDQPILRRLMIEAPGTYNHSVIVGTMAEAAAAEIRANPLLTRVCGYYHDIGKITKPLYFIENQTPGKNKHDKLAPSMSALIITAHIKDGVEIARKEKLGSDIIDTIKQHHGTSLLSFFYEKAKQLKGADQTLNSEDFRYPGPKPQTRETGIVMLADVVEAASRTLDNPTPSRIQGLVQNLINKIFIDGQLDECELTLKDLHSIAKSFNKILNGIYHHRIEYQESSAHGEEKKDKDDEHTDRKQTDTPKSGQDNTEDKSQSHIKRLGIS